ncbi:MAG: phosphatidate cytidylyltransferase [Gammaproteobacteria bacterium]
MSRVVTALVLLPPLLAVILFAPAWGFLLLAELAGLLGVRELYDLAERNGHRAFRSIGYTATFLIVVSFYPGWPSIAAIVVAFVLVVGVAAVLRGNPTRETLGDVATTILAPLYGGLLIGTLVGVRLAGPGASGRYWVLFLLAVIMMGDTGAYYAGRAFGRRKLAPSVSPNKTIEGLLGGILAAVAAALLASRLFLPEVHLLRAGILGLILSLLGVAGDLFESLLKRSAGVKNTSGLIPGHGGVLDRLDSLYFSAPVLFVYLQLAAK